VIVSESFPAFGLRIPIELKTLVNSAAVPKIKSIADEKQNGGFAVRLLRVGVSTENGQL